jgi:subtilisin family serine protease
MSQLTLKLPPLEPEFVMQAMSEVYDWGLQDLNIPDIHREVLGNGIKICIVDSGASNHFEVANAVAGARNFAKTQDTKDHLGHSTFVSGIICAAKNNQGIVGVAPKAKIYFAKAMEDSGSGSPSAMVNAILWGIKKKVDIISISAGMFFDFKPLHKAVQQAYKKNIIIVAAAGNTGSRHYDVAFPARYPEVIGVAAYDSKRKTASFSSRGLNVACAMPGVDIYSTWLDQQFCRNNGTSFAAPMLSGICALILAKHRQVAKSKTPCRTPKEMMEHLEKYAVNLDKPDATGFGTIDMRTMFSRDI